ncbi:Ectonucleoside triphosphate diphosphohydrolase, putative [Perkinsus marinus ATCC 50983]|uniref:Ectonucleoside triphosphate diphosphohydrolase, putative n=1 Tax=Perkinsus marinus (strain ATCC 50983 / TXsc) TaxID=423536 RepID=C5KKD1_PERM5|nr:Ectonucleoside triphosphate diphosphohydrolase, putative [Perkinsus marinus ATCC 50983]EER15043.1 Ectonucleoside triphosphate diphosphohydrolase, putative [Perkinsus marinus ATCC 50983]|eukprot:XP_002783247.1 Ectonucleoside triphosphate diphosphohydrolase, putative [Perkinsus marinus ATCC 50983]
MRDVVPARRDALMKECIRYLKETPFYFREDYAQVLSGEEEAAFGWLSLNADNRTLAGYNQDASLGWLDMGGASFQVAFVPTRAHYVLQNLFPLALSPRGYSSIRLYTKSYLHYGLVEANRRVSAAIISKELLRVDSVSTINNPCYFKGMDYQPDFATALFQIPLAVADSLGLHATGSLEEWHQATRRVCSMAYKEFTTTYSHVKHRRRDGLCFDATYLYVLLSEFLKFGSAVNTTLEFRKYTRSGIELDWTSGSVTYTASATPTVTIAAYRKEVSLAYVESREGFLGELSEEALNATFGETGLRGTKPLFVDDSFPPYSNDDDELLEELELEELLSSREPELARIPELDIMT